MIVDTSAVLAVLFDEPDAERYVRALAGASRCRMSVVSFLEAAIVLESRAGAAAGPDLDLLLERAPIELEPVTLNTPKPRAGPGDGSAGATTGRHSTSVIASPMLWRKPPANPFCSKVRISRLRTSTRHSVIGRLTEST